AIWCHRQLPAGRGRHSRLGAGPIWAAAALVLACMACVRVDGRRDASGRFIATARLGAGTNADVSRRLSAAGSCRRSELDGFDCGRGGADSQRFYWLRASQYPEWLSCRWLISELLVVVDHLGDHEVQELFGESRIELGFGGEFA